MTDEKFCEMYSAFHGDGIDHIDQLVQHTFTGEELKEFIEFAIKFRNKDTKMKLTKELYEFIERECKHSAIVFINKMCDILEVMP